MNLRPVTDLLALALAAADATNDAARLVLADALEETGWWDLRLEGLWTDEHELSAMTFCIDDAVTPDFARAIAAVLLFGEWIEGDDTTNPPVLPWPLADAARHWTPEEKRVHLLLADIRVDDLLARCERALAKRRHPAEVELVMLRRGRVEVHAHADVPAHAVAAVERELDAWLPFCAVFKMTAGARARRR